MSDRRRLLGDAIAGSSVAFIVVPQALAYAEIAGMPPVTGLWAAGIPAVVAAFFASSRYLQTGPTAMTALLSFGAISAISAPGTTDFITLSVLLALLVGVIRIGLGLFRLGGLTDYMSTPVIMGFTSGAAILIVASQLPAVTGLTSPPVSLIARIPDTLARVDAWEPTAVVLALAVAATIALTRRLGPLVPGVLIAVVVSTVIGKMTSIGGPPVGEIPEGLPALALGFDWSRIPDVLIPAIAIAVIGFAEPTAIARTMALEERQPWDASRELISQGIASVASSIFGGFAVGGSFSRSAVNRLAGAQSRRAGAITGLIVLAFTPFAGILSSLPRAVLGAIVITATIRLIQPAALRQLLAISRPQGSVALTTMVATLVMAPRIDLGVVIGIAVAAFTHIVREARSASIECRYENFTLEVKPSGVLFYGSAARLNREITALVAQHPDCKEIVLDLHRLGRIDYSGVSMLLDSASQAEHGGLTVRFTQIPQHALRLFHRARS
jgi:SulP family sulfate permease